MEEISNPISNFYFEQNYPNPFDPVTNIQYAVSSRQFVKLTVYDILGNEIATLLNEERPEGRYEVEFSIYSGEVRNLRAEFIFTDCRRVHLFKHVK